MERRLAAILSADVVGYSRLVRADEEGTLAAFKTLLSDLVEPTTAQHHGRIVKLIGDGILAEFGSAVDAVQAAYAIQQELAQRNASLPVDRRMELRMGINLGDVVIDGEDIQGDGVNVASRLEGLSDPGGLCISGKVFEEVRDRTDLAFEDLGNRQVKNIDRPVHVYRLAQGSRAADRGPARVRHAPADGRRRLHWIIGGAAVALVLAVALLGTLSSDPPSPVVTGIPTVAVVPFESIGIGPAQADFVAGLTEDLRITLSGETGLQVISAAVATGPDAKPDALYVIEGSVRQSESRIRITASLISAETGIHLWGGRYDRDTGNTLTVQEEVARKIAGSLAVKLSAAETERKSGGATTSILWEGLAALGRAGERTISYSVNLFSGAPDRDVDGS